MYFETITRYEYYRGIMTNQKNKIHIKAYAKINLGLDVLGVLDNGYHLVHMIMQSIGLYDGIYITKTRKPGISMSSNLHYLPNDQRNIAYRAGLLLDEDYGILANTGIHIKIDKRIPVSAGLAGGSSNAAAVLMGLNDMFDLGLAMDTLCEYGLRLGADVPFCLRLGTMLAEGIGEDLSRLPAMPDCTILIAKPPKPVSTKMVYENLDHLAIHGWDQLPHPQNDRLIQGLEEGDIHKIASSMGNVLEQVTIPLLPTIQTIKEIMMNAGAIGAMMSGSGPTVFGIFEDRELAMKAKAQIYDQRLSRQAYITYPYNSTHPT